MEFCYFFFFQAEDGIRDVAVTGVQTCALPISWAALLIMEPASTSATNTWRIDQPPVSPEIGTRRRECVATLKPSLTGRHRFHAITNGVLAGIGPICLGHESHTAGLNCAGSRPNGKTLPGEAVSPLSWSHDRPPISPLDERAYASHSPPP